jgi:hypothetical protein
VFDLAPLAAIPENQVTESQAVQSRSVLIVHPDPTQASAVGTLVERAGADWEHHVELPERFGGSVGNEWDAVFLFESVVAIESDDHMFD